MTTQAISARGLLRETFAVFRPIYFPLLVITSLTYIFLLVITSLSLVLNLLNSTRIFGSTSVPLNVIYWFCIMPFLSGASFFYTYRSLSGNTVNLKEAFKQANRNIAQLILGWLLFIIIFCTGFILLIIPGLYLLYRLVFVLYAIAIENCSAIEGLRRSWELTKGRWWLIFRSNLLLSVVLFMPVVLVILLVDPTGKSMLAQIVSGVMGFLISPFMSINFVLLYMRLKDRAANL